MSSPAPLIPMPHRLEGLYRTVRRQSEALAAPLSAEDCALQSMPDASPVKWHLAHTSWFFERLVLMERPHYRPFDPAYLYLFNSYYEGLGPRHPRSERGLLSRPSLEEVMAYRAHVDAAMEKLLAELSEDAAEEKQIELGLHHEQQHQELILTDIKHALFANPLLPAYAADAPMPPPCGKAEWVAHPGGLVEVGHRGETFCFDNEQPAHPVMLRPFRIQSRPVSNGDFLSFIQDGGYRRPEFWLSDGWTRVQSEKWEAPLYWLKGDDGQHSLFSLRGVTPLDPLAPLMHVSFYEAAAYAAWAGKRLPTEFEWEAVAQAVPGKVCSGFPSGTATDETAGRGDFRHGAVWEWTRSSYDPYPGFRPFAGAVAEYNGKFMVGQMVLRGGSFASPPGHIRASYRNFFPASARWQFSGLRLAEDA